MNKNLGVLNNIDFNDNLLYKWYLIQGNQTLAGLITLFTGITALI